MLLYMMHNGMNDLKKSSSINHFVLNELRKELRITSTILLLNIALAKSIVG